MYLHLLLLLWRTTYNTYKSLSCYFYYFNNTQHLSNRNWCNISICQCQSTHLAKNSMVVYEELEGRGKQEEPVIQPKLRPPPVRWADAVVDLKKKKAPSPTVFTKQEKRIVLAIKMSFSFSWGFINGIISLLSNRYATMMTGNLLALAI